MFSDSTDSHPVESLEGLRSRLQWDFGWWNMKSVITLSICTKNCRPSTPSASIVKGGKLGQRLSTLSHATSAGKRRVDHVDLPVVELG